MKFRSLKLVADLFILAATVMFLALAGICAVAYSNNSAYLNAPGCAPAHQVLSEKCFVKVSATVVRKWTEHNWGTIGPETPMLMVKSPRTEPELVTMHIAQPTKAYYQLTTGQSVVLKIWNDLPTGVYGPHGQAMRSQFNPLTWADQDEWGGLALLGCAAVLLAAHPPRFLLPRRFANRPANSLLERWEGPMGKPDHVFRYGPLRFAVTVLILLNLLDILTSLIGARDGLYEQNPIAYALVESIGPLGGFLGLKLPGCLVVVLAASKLPRKMAVMVTYAGCAVMLLVVVDNLQQEVVIQERPAVVVQAAGPPLSLDLPRGPDRIIGR